MCCKVVTEDCLTGMQKWHECLQIQMQCDSNLLGHGATCGMHICSCNGYILILYGDCVSLCLCGTYKYGIIIASEDSSLAVTWVPHALSHLFHTKSLWATHPWKRRLNLRGQGACTRSCQQMITGRFVFSNVVLLSYHVTSCFYRITICSPYKHIWNT